MSNPSIQKALEAVMSAPSANGQPSSNNQEIRKSAIMEMVRSMELKKSEDENINDIAQSLKKNHNVPTKVSKAAARIIFKANRAELQEYQNQVDQLLHEIMK